MSKNLNTNDSLASDRNKSQTFYERLTNSQAHAILFACGVGLIALALVKIVTGERTESSARWRWLFQFARDWLALDAYGEAMLVGLIGVLMISWAVVGTGKQIDHNHK